MVGVLGFGAPEAVAAAHAVEEIAVGLPWLVRLRAAVSVSVTVLGKWALGRGAHADVRHLCPLPRYPGRRGCGWRGEGEGRPSCTALSERELASAARKSPCH